MSADRQLGSLEGPDRLQERERAISFDEHALLATWRRIGKINPETLLPPPGFPTSDEFKANLQKRLQNESARAPLPPGLRPLATDVARYARGDWGRTFEQVGSFDYFYQVGMMMVGAQLYRGVFSKRIVVDKDWQVREDGLQRALVLRTLGAKTVANQRIQMWVGIAPGKV